MAALQVPETVQARTREFADKSNAGSLTPEEEAEYGTLVEYGNMLSVIEARARKAVSDTTGSGSQPKQSNGAQLVPTSHSRKGD